MQAKLDDQLKVLRLAELDLQAASLNQKAKTLPAAALHKDLTIEFETNRDLRIAAETELNDVKRELSRAEGDVEQIVTRITRDEARLISGSATPKELEQLQHEVGTLGAR